MIRINLLPKTKKQAQAQSSGSGPLWAGIYLLATFLWGIGLALVYFQYQGELEGIQRANRDLDAEIADLEQRTARLDELRAQLARSVRLEEVVAELNAARTGPLRVMMELSRILRNQESIRGNQKLILTNQGKIQSNQGKLDQILANQKAILTNQKKLLARG